MKQAALICAPLLAWACASAPPAEPIEAPRVSAGALQVAQTLVRGFDALEPGPASWRVGDRLLFGVARASGDDREEWLVRFEVTALIGAGEDERATVDVRLYDKDGELLVESQTAIATAHFGGFFEACDTAEEEYARLEEATVRGDYDDVLPETNAHRGVRALVSLFDALQSNEALAEILWDVVERPSLLSVVARFGVRLSIAVQFDESESVSRVQEANVSARPGFDLPVALELNGNPALDVTLRVVEAQAPLHLAAGVVSFDAVHPTDPTRRATLRVLAARRGKAR